MSDSLPNQKKLISISGAAKVFGVSIDTIRRWDKSGVLHSVRPDGKNRYFSLEELENHKSHQPLPISEVAKKLCISPTTLRRLEGRTLIKPKRNGAGERVYDKESLQTFLNSDYFLKNNRVTDETLESFRKEIELIEDLPSEAGTQHFEARELADNVEDSPPEKSSEFFKNIGLKPNLKSQKRIPEFLLASVIFLLLFAIGVTNIQVSKAVSYQKGSAPAVLSTSVEKEQVRIAPAEAVNTTSAQEVSAASADEESIAPAVTESTPSAEPESTASGDPLLILKIRAVVKINDGASVNIRREPTTQGEKIGTAKDGDVFDFISIDSGWYGIKLADGSTGFIPATYVEMTEETNEE